MSFFESILLGIVQGATEFFPVSSSAHLKIFKHLLSIEDRSVFFDLTCHFGTLLALVFFLKKEIVSVFKDKKKIGLYFLALLPLPPVYFFLKPLRETASNPEFLGYFLILTSSFLFLASYKRDKLSETKKWQHVLCIGVMQTMALIPGISRSGSTISTARFCGWSFKEAALFSFMLAIPTILGGELLEILKSKDVFSEDLTVYAGGFFSSLIVGMLSVRFVFWIYEKEKVRPIAWYCFAVGLFAWGLFHG